MKKNIIILILFLIITALIIELVYYRGKQKITKQKEVVTNLSNYDSSCMDSLKTNIILSGDCTSYYELKVMYIDYDAEDFLFWSMYMANKYDYAPAYYDVYQTFGRALDLKEPYPKKELGENNYKLALEYLNIAARKNFLPAKNTLEKYNK